MKRLLILSVLLLSMMVIFNSCGGGGGGGGGGDNNNGGGNDTTSVSGKVTLSGTGSGKPLSESSSLISSVLSAAGIHMAPGDPLVDAIVEMYNADRPEWLYPVAVTQTDSNGDYMLRTLTHASDNYGATYTNGADIPAGNYTIIAWKYEFSTGKLYIATQGYVKNFTGAVTGNNLETQDSSTTPQVESMFGLPPNPDDTFGSPTHPVASNAAVQVTFNCAMLRQSLLNSISIVSSVTGTVNGTWKVSPDLKTATFYPVSKMTNTGGSEVYTVTVLGGDDSNAAQSLYQIKLPATVTGQFYSPGDDNVNPNITRISPATSTNVLVTTPIRIASNDVLDINSFVITSNPSIGVRPAVVYVGKTTEHGEFEYVYEIIPQARLLPDSVYHITVGGTKDLAGNPLLLPESIDFGTESSSAPPSVIASSITPTGTNVIANPVIMAAFAGSVDPATVVKDSTFIVSNGTTTVAGDLVFQDNAITFTPASPLDYSATYTVTITTGVHNLWGVPMAADYIWNFTTMAQPTATLSIDSGAAYTKNSTATLTITLAGGGIIDQMRFSNDNSTWSTPEAYASTKSGWPLAAGDGTKTVYAQVHDTVTGWLSVFIDTIVKDTQGPTGTIAINSGNAATRYTSVTIYNSVTDATSGTYQMQVSDNGGASWSTAENYASTRAWTFPAGDGTKTIWVKVTDRAGNSTTFTDTIILDTVAPSTGSVSINSGATYATSTTVTVTLSSSDALSGVTNMQTYYWNGTSWVSQGYEAYATSKSITLSAGDGTRYIGTYFYDAAGNISSWYTDTIILDTAAPTYTSTPAAGATGVSTSTTITVNFSDATSGVNQSTITAANLGLQYRTCTKTIPIICTYYDVAFTTSVGANTVTMTPSAALSSARTYYVRLKAVADNAGNPMNTYFTFTTQ